MKAGFSSWSFAAKWTRFAAAPLAAPAPVSMSISTPSHPGYKVDHLATSMAIASAAAFDARNGHGLVFVE